LLKQQSAETPDELLLIHPADRLMIRLIKIPYLADRLKGMQYKVNFEETISLIEKVGICTAVSWWPIKTDICHPARRRWCSSKTLATICEKPHTLRLSSMSYYSWVITSTAATTPAAHGVSS
jgi:hypothetical protein